MEKHTIQKRDGHLVVYVAWPVLGGIALATVAGISVGGIVALSTGELATAARIGGYVWFVTSGVVTLALGWYAAREWAGPRMAERKAEMQYWEPEPYDPDPPPPMVVRGLSRKMLPATVDHSIEASLDLALLVEREEHSDSVQLKSTKVRGPDVLPFGALFTYAHKTGTNELAEARFWGVPIEDLVSDAAIDRAVIEILDGETMNKTALTKAVKESLPDVGTNRIRNRIDWLFAAGTIVMEPGSRGSKQYHLPAMRF